MEAQRITIALTDYSAGFKATPDWGRWGDWAVLSADVATLLRGEIQDSGGITKANAHIMLPDGRTLKVTTERDVLRKDKVNRLYKLAMLRIKAEYNVLTRVARRI